jgi:hypothetical protein
LRDSFHAFGLLIDNFCQKVIAAKQGKSKRQKPKHGRPTNAIAPEPYNCTPYAAHAWRAIGKRFVHPHIVAVNRQPVEQVAYLLIELYEAINAPNERNGKW